MISCQNTLCKCVILASLGCDIIIQNTQFDIIRQKEFSIPMYSLYIEMNSNKFTRYYYTNDAMLRTSDAAVFSDINFH